MEKETAFAIGYFVMGALVFVVDQLIGHSQKAPSLRMVLMLILAFTGGRLAEAYLPALFH